MALFDGIVCCYLDCQITELYHESVEKIRDSNKWDLVRPAFTCDLWRSRTRREYFTLTMHYIDVKRGDAGTQWLLRKRILGSVPVHATKIDHEGDNNGHWPAFSALLGMLWSIFLYGCYMVQYNFALQLDCVLFALHQWSLAWQDRSSRSITSSGGCQRLSLMLAAMYGERWPG